MQRTPIQARRADSSRHAGAIACFGLGAVLAALTAAPVHAATALADSPVFAVQQAPGNVALVLSVEFPTVVSVAYTDRTYHSAGADYLGYFDPGKCYDYQSSASDTTLAPSATAGSYFVPSGFANAHICVGKWSGHFLNWATMQTIDPFRWVLTGGYRVLDTPTATVIEKAWGTGQGGTGNFPDGSIPAAEIAGATPFGALVSKGTTALQFRIAGQGNQMVFGAPGPALAYNVVYYKCNNFSCPAITPSPPTVPNLNGIVTGASPDLADGIGTKNGSNYEYFGARYTTSIIVPQTGNYYFQLIGDDRATLYLNSSPTPLLSSNYSNSVSSPAALSAAVPLTAGDTLTVRIDYAQDTGGAVLQLNWQIPGSSSLATFGTIAGTLDYKGAQAGQNVPYSLFVRAKVCDNSLGIAYLEANCVVYAQAYKPQGLIQAYSGKLRFSALGYLNDDNILRDGGVLRAKQKFVGPTQPVPGAPAITNTGAEWDPLTGIYVTNPDAADANATNAAFGTSVANSGVMNYLNKFGELTHGTDKTYDPVSELYYAAVRYFRNLGNVPAWSNMAATDAAKFTDGFPVITTWGDPILYGCQKNFILGIGDVNTHADKNVPGNTNSAQEPTIPSEVSGDIRVPSGVTATNKVGVLEGLGASWNPLNLGSDNNSALIAGLAYDAHVNDIRPSDFLPASGSKQRADYSTIDTYWVDVQEGQVYKNNNQFYLATKYGGFAVPSTYNYGDAIPSVSSWHTNTVTNGSNLQPDNYFSGGSPDLMRSGLTAAFADIASKQKPVTTTFSTAISQVGTGGNATFSSQYVAANWTGEVTAGELSFSSTNDPVSTPRWTLAALLKTQLTTSAGWDVNRRVVTWNTATSAAVPFRASSLSTAQLAALDTSYVSGNDSSNFLNYLRGDQTNEVGSAVTGSTKAYRARTQLLGDIVGSKVLVVGPPAFPYLDATNPGYAAFKSSYASRPTIIYFGANDGMLHAVNGDLASATTVPSGRGGDELFSYVPGALFSGPNGTPNVDGLASLGNPAFNHHFMVDATPAQYDVDFTRVPGASATAAGDWHSLLIGGLGKGGKSYYAIDVTDPAALISATTSPASSTAGDIAIETGIAGKVLWEFSASSALGYSFGDPIVAKTKKYGWVVVLPSGYNSADGKGRLFLLNPKTGALLEPPLETGVGSVANDAGLAQVNSFINDSTDGTVDSLYAGDLLGNLWRFDMTALPGTGNYPAPTRIATLTDSLGTAQPVTTAPSLAVDPTSRKRFVLVGTGRLLDSTDIASTQQQTFYAIVDGSDARFNTAADLPKGPPAVSFPISRASLYNNVSSTDGVTFNSGTQAGWYEDLGLAGGGGANTGWRVLLNPTTLSGAVVFSSTRPDLSNVCSPGGTSRLYGRTFGNTETVLLTQPTATVPAAATSYYSYSDVISDQRFFSVAGSAKVIVGTSKGLDDPNLKPLQGQTLRRLNWRELRVVD